MAVGILAIAAAAAVRTVQHRAPPAPSSAIQAGPPARPAPPRRPVSWGINLNSLHNWTNERAFMNLVVTDRWHSTAATWPAFDPARIAADGTLLSLRAGEQAVAPMSFPPASHSRDVRVRCTWAGQGDADAFGGRDVSHHGSSMEFTWPKAAQVGFLVTRTDAANPIRQVDCREAAADPKARFDPVFLASLKPYKVVRFQGWQTVNSNTGGDWAKRTLPGWQFVSGPDGVSVEDMVALCNEAGVDPWFAMDWKADATYLANFARYVHEHLDPARTVYLEIGNEVWNWNFPNSHFALDEGKAEGLDANGDGNVGRMRRYAEKATQGFAIWTKEYGPDRKRVVRVLAGQSVWPDLLKLALDYKDTASQVDAIAMAPYFGYDLFATPRDTADIDGLFRDLQPKMEESIAVMAKDKALADSYGVRLISYEAGQHLDYRGPDQSVIARLARDPRMGDLYRRYLAGWKAQAGDLMMLFTNVDPAGPATDWGMVEYPGQPPEQAPKLRALIDTQAGQ